MARKSHHRKRNRATRSGFGPASWLLAASIWIIPAAGGYLIYKSMNDDFLGSADDGRRFSRPHPVATVTPIQHGPVQQLEVSSSVILNPQSAELYNRIAERSRQKQEAKVQPDPAPDATIDILGPRWLLSQRGDAFTIQYLTSADIDELVAFSEHFSAEQPTTIYPYKQSGNTVEYGLASGIFDSLDSAQKSLQSHPTHLLTHNPWIRPVEQLSRQIRTFIDR